MTDHTENKIQAVYDVALKLGLDSANNIEKSIFKNMLREIAASAIDTARNKVTELLGDESHKYNHK